MGALLSLVLDRRDLVAEQRVAKQASAASPSRLIAGSPRPLNSPPSP
jgi:hypothetical protein